MTASNLAPPYVSPYPDDPRPEPAHLLVRPRVPDYARAGGRRDPFYSGMWPTHDSFTWQSADSARLLTVRGSATRPIPTVNAAWKHVLAHLEETIEIVSVVASYRTLTFTQIAGFVRHQPTDDFSHLIHTLFAAGILDRGIHIPSIVAGADPNNLDLYAFHLNNATDWRTTLNRHLTLPGRWAVAAGTPLSVGGQYARHNILTAELLLRAAAYLPVTVAGEAQSFLTDLVDAGSHRSAKRADGIIVRDDDFILGIETTASSSRGLEDKVIAWADALRGAPGGRAVLFLDAIPLTESKTTYAQFQHRIAKIIRRHLDGAWNRTIRERILTASWKSWFHPDGPTSEFGSLMCQRYEVDSRQWVNVTVLGDGRMVNPEPTTHIHRGLQATLVSPAWTRTDPLPIWAGLAHGAGVDVPPIDMRLRRRVSPPRALSPGAPRSKDVEAVRRANLVRMGEV